jgi:DNA (cytosine-5)-methyltransferase 1
LLVHPAEGRHLSVLECLLLQGAPPGFRVLGSLKQRYAQVGNGVPPALMAAVCGAVAKALGSGVDGNFPCQEKRCGVNAAG